jgi:hypothetical protein
MTVQLHFLLVNSYQTHRTVNSPATAKGLLFRYNSDTNYNKKAFWGSVVLY